MLILFLFEVPARAAPLSLQVGKNHYELIEKDDHLIKLEKSCWDNSVKCVAFSKMRSLNLNDYHRKASLDGGKNPAAIFCTEGAGGRLALAQDSRSYQYSICLFQDSSVITTDSLYYAARKNSANSRKPGQH